MGYEMTAEATCVSLLTHHSAANIDIIKGNSLLQMSLIATLVEQLHHDVTEGPHQLVIILSRIVYAAGMIIIQYL